MKLMRVYVEVVTDDGIWHEYSTGMQYNIKHKDLLNQVCNMLTSMNDGE